MENYFKTNLVFLREKKGETQLETATALGLTRSTYANYEVGANLPKADILQKIIGHFETDFNTIMSSDLSNLSFNPVSTSSKKVNNPQVSPQFSAQIDTKKHILNEPEAVYYRMPQVITLDSQGNDNMVMVPVKARAGYLLGYGDTDFIQTLPTYRLPGFNNGTFRLFESQGLSMYPTFNDRDILITQFLENINEIRDDRVYVIVTKTDGVVVKRCLNRIKTDNKLILKSDNIKHREEYPNIIVPPEDILEVWYAIAYMSRQMRSPSEMYTRMIDLEARLTILEQSGGKK